MSTGQPTLEPLRLEVTDAQGERTVVVDSSPFSIGRRENNTLRLGGSEVWREHIVIEQIDGVWMVRDLQSRSGTSVNDQPLTSQPLKSGDRIRLGLVAHFFAAVSDFTHGTAQGDDITAMVIRYRGADAA